MYSRAWGASSKEFFNEKDTHNYFAGYYDRMRSEVEQMTDEEIVACNVQEWASYLADKYYITPIILFESNVERTLSERKVKKENPFRGYQYERDFFEIDGVCVTFKIPFDGQPDLFSLQPRSRILTRFKTECFVEPRGEECGSFTLDFEYTKQELQDKGEKMLEYVNQRFDHDFEIIRR